MKKDLDQLIAEFKKMNAQSGLEPGQARKAASDSFDEMSWEERGQLLLELIESRGGSISQQELLNTDIDKLGIANSEDGRQYLRNFLSQFIQQKLIRKKKIKNKIYLTLSHHRSSNIKEYFSLFSVKTEQKIPFKKAAELKYIKRLKILINVLKERGQFPIDTLFGELMAEIGFHNDSSGKAEAHEFLTRALENKQVHVIKKNSTSWLVLPEPGQTVTPRKKRKSSNGDKLEQSKTPVSQSSPITRQTKKRKDSQPETHSGPAPLSVQKALDLFYWKVKLENQISDLDDEIIRIAEFKKRYRAQLAHISQKIVEIFELRKSAG
ncbi:hypothetical protein ACFL27_13340 [candidate division CSSED10-310 bacterium]|uniref:Uncharacterized protein n=1 Tax=candidate division CSSED10-310 bacterium TaxID=2855610 RepID=A0ABV6YYM5_UNCC1